jgi:hypothetical protein
MFLKRRHGKGTHLFASEMHLIATRDGQESRNGEEHEGLRGLGATADEGFRGLLSRCGRECFSTARYQVRGNNAAHSERNTNACSWYTPQQYQTLFLFIQVTSSVEQEVMLNNETWNL